MIDKDKKIDEMEKEINHLKAHIKKLEKYERAKMFHKFTTNKQALLRMYEALHGYKKEIATDKQLSSVLSDFFETFISFFEMEPILDFGDVISFDPEIHRHDVRVKIQKGTTAIVILPGWKLIGSDECVKPLVKAKA